MSSSLQLLINKFHNYIKYEKQYSEHTIKNYLIDLSQFKDNFDTDDISTITTSNLQDYISSLHTMGLDSSTIARKKSSISSLFNFFCKKKIIDKNPCKKLISPKRKSKIPMVMSNSNKNIHKTHYQYGKTFIIVDKSISITRKLHLW